MTEKAFGRKAVSMFLKRHCCLSTRSITFSILTIALAFCVACQHNRQSNSADKTSVADTVRFHSKVEAEYADGFRISYHENYKLLEILKPFQNKVDTLRYSLVPRALTDEVDVENTEEIPIPINSLIATSTTHIGFIEMLESNEVIEAVAGIDYVYSKDIRQRLDEGEIIGLPQGELNKEKVLTLAPDLLMISGGQSSQFENYKVLRDADINMMVNSEWLETTPLGKAEWMKVIAALLDKEKLANEKFDAIAQKYKELESTVNDVRDKPLVINNIPYKGAWFVASGESYMAQFLRDAGADYPWYDSEQTGGLRKSFEVVYEFGLKADIWLNPGAAKSKEDILAKDSRFSDFKPFQTGAIYNNNKRLSESGGNDFWESGVVHPEIILADLIKIFHPQILPDHKLYFYQKIE
jgi:iron complex transport system substrate-binding protein